MEFGIVGRQTAGFFRYQAWPTVARDGEGVVYVACSGHRLGHVCPFGKNYLYISRDDGKSWEGPIIANDTCLDDRDGGLYAWGRGELILSWFNHTTDLYDSREARTPLLKEPLAMGARQAWKTLQPEQYRPGAFIRRSHDGGKTWEEAVQVPVTSPHGPIRKADGTLLFLGKEFRWGKDLEEDALYVYESRDEGKSWQQLSHIPFPAGFDGETIHEPFALELSDGTILATLRGHELGLPGKLCTFVMRSEDGGKTFDTPVRMDHLGAPAHLLAHSSGAIVMVYSRRYPPHGQYARISWDGGRSWSAEFLISPEAPDWDHGYPSSTELSNGSILTVFYQKYPGDNYNSILYSRWQLPEK